MCKFFFPYESYYFNEYWTKFKTNCWIHDHFTKMHYYFSKNRQNAWYSMTEFQNFRANSIQFLLKSENYYLRSVVRDYHWSGFPLERETVRISHLKKISVREFLAVRKYFILMQDSLWRKVNFNTHFYLAKPLIASLKKFQPYS